MTGDYTKVPLRRDDRWTGARMQQGRVLLDHEWNFNVDAAARANREAARDAIGWAGVVADSSAFNVSFPGGVLTIDAGVMWVDGLAAFAPASFTYESQSLIAALPPPGHALVYLDVWEEHVQPAEDPNDLVDPALRPIDTCGRTRVGYRVRVAGTAAATCKDAWAALATQPESTGTMTITRASAPPPSDPCAPPGDPLAQLPDGLFRVEVLDAGTTAANTRFVWAFDDGAHAVPVVSFAGDTVQLAPSNLHFADGDLVEVSWLERRADRQNHGALYSVQVTPGAAGDSLKLDRAVAAPAGGFGLCVRRWDGQTVGAAAATSALWRGTDLGIRFTASAGTYQPGDWWGAELRSEAGDGIEHRTNAASDGIEHSFAPLALVDLGSMSPIFDCRPKFTSLVDLDFECGACTVSAKPGDDLQAKADSLPAGGGELCLAAGLYTLERPLSIQNRQRVVINGAGPATILQAVRREAAVMFQSCTEVEVRDVRVEGGTPGSPPGDPGLEGALTFLSCRDVVVQDCVLSCPDQVGRAQTCISVESAGRTKPDGIVIERNRLEVGAWQTGILVVDSAATRIAGNRVHLVALAPGAAPVRESPMLAQELTKTLRAGLRAKAGAGVSRVAMEGQDAPINVTTGSDAEIITRDFARLTTASQITRGGGTDKAVLKFVRGVAQGKQLEEISPELLQIITNLAQQFRAVGQGIVVAGTTVGTVQIDGNLVEDTVQGIHVGVSDANLKARESADAVVVSRNVVHGLVPADYGRDRHGLFVGNARSVHVVDTVATLRRVGTVPAGQQPTPVEGIRVHGTLGPFLTVRQSSLEGFSIGVRVVPLPPVPKSRMWLVAETFAAGATKVLDAPATVVSQRNPV